MKRSLSTLLIFIYCYLLLSINNTVANQAEQLKRLIHSTNPSNSFSYDPIKDSFTSKDFSQVHVSPQDGKMEADKITKLPGQSSGVNFDQYAGYVTVDESNGRALFYYFVESAHNSSTKPLVLWLSGGPGCSSLGGGALLEIGPFKVNSDGKTLRRNQFAWNNAANVIFLESPFGVGFSYSNTSSDYDKFGDKITAEDSYTFIINWLERFPNYKTREFFITGESYAGHFIPELTHIILQRNKFMKHTINLQGIAIGNAFVDYVSNSIGHLDYLWSHALISDVAYARILKICKSTGNSLSENCLAASRNLQAELGYISQYNIYAPLCISSQSSTKRECMVDEMEGPNDQRLSRMSCAMLGSAYDPCAYHYVHSYLNNPSVQEALHAIVTRLPYSWELCNEQLQQKWNDARHSMLPVIKKIISSSNIRFWLFSGDIDAIVPITSTRYAIKKLGLTVKNPWRAWYLNNIEVGGYIEEYNGLTLATVREAGHEVPIDQPERALVMISSFFQGNLPP